MSAGDNEPTISSTDKDVAPSAHPGKETTSTTTTTITSTSTSIEVLPANATLYVSNIDWSLKKNILRRALLTLFERHGKVLEVVTLRREGLRGQAWIIFEETSSAISAQRNENGFVFFGKSLKVNFARETSDRIAKRDGTYVPKDRRIKKTKIKSDMGVNDAPTSGGAAAGEGQGDGNRRMDTGDGSSSPPPSSSTLPSEPPQSYSSTSTDAPPSNTTTTSQTTPSSTHAAPPSAPSETPAPPSNILFAQDLPTECNEMMLAMLFRQYVGYKEVRIPRAGLAFIEFDEETHATLALRGLNGFNITSADTLNLKYSK